MQVHHLNCGTLCPYGGGGETWVCHCLLVESPAGLVLVDTGFGLADIGDFPARIGAAPVIAGRPKLDPAECAVRQVERLGYSARDVRHVVVTHLDFDHAGGISDFPDAEIHVFRPEHEAAMRRAAGVEKKRYRAVQWAHGPKWAIHDVAGEHWLRFEAVRAIPGTEVLLVPMIGHTRGHCAVAVEDDDGWLLHCGDAYFDHQEMNVAHPRCPPALAMFQRVIAMDNGARLRNQERLRELARDYEGRVRLFCAHSETELRELTRRSSSRGGPSSLR